MLSCRESKMNKQSIIVCLFLIFLLFHSSYSYERPQAYLYLDSNQEFSKKNAVKNILETYIVQAVPIAAPFVALGKCVVSWIKNRRNNKIKRNTSNQPYTLINKQELDYYPTAKIALPEKSINIPCKKISKQLL